MVVHIHSVGSHNLFNHTVNMQHMPEASEMVHSQRTTSATCRTLQSCDTQTCQQQLLSLRWSNQQFVDIYGDISIHIIIKLMQTSDTFVELKMSDQKPT